MEIRERSVIGRKKSKRKKYRHRRPKALGAHEHSHKHYGMDGEHEHDHWHINHLSHVKNEENPSSRANLHYHDKDAKSLPGGPWLYGYKQFHENKNDYERDYRDLPYGLEDINFGRPPRAQSQRNGGWHDMEQAAWHDDAVMQGALDDDVIF